MSANEQLVNSWIQDFRDAHETDPRNAGRQSFEDYWAWVKVFLVTGAAGQRGWLDEGEQVVRGVRDEATAEALRGRLRAVGRTIAAEWAKDSRCRSIHTTILQGSPNLRDWGRQLQRAAAADAGNGAAVGVALDAIEREVRSAIGR